MTSAETLSPPPRELRPHQRDAVNAVDTSLARQQVIMACGTGKTITGMHAVAKLLGGARGRVLLLVPTLTLLEQTYAAWLADAPFDFNALAVCSKLSVVERRAVGVESDADVDELSLRATTDPAAVAAFLAGAGTRIVFATYQSLGAIIDAHRDGAPDWNVIVCDEAHRTAGAAGKAFGRVLRDEHVPGDRRLFLTATPRVHTVATKASDKGGETLLMSMDDENVYGPQVYTLSVAEAVERGILSQYRVAVIGVSDAELSSAAQVLDTIMVDGHELNTDHVASIIALSKAARGIGLHSVIAYFNSRATSRAFVEAFRIVHDSRSMLLSGGTAEHIDGNMKLTDRAAALSRLATVGVDGFHLVSNARCLTEGIDVPVLDGVLFGEPRSSQIDVVQCVGRAIRKNPRTDNPALIVLAVRTGDGQDAEAAIAEAGFTKVRQVLAALGDHDPRIAEAARALSRDRGEDAGDGDRPSREEIEQARRLIDLDISPELLHSGFGLKILLNQGEQAWERGYAELCEYVAKSGDSQPLRDVVSDSGFKLGEWVSRQRSAQRAGVLPAPRARQLNLLPGWVSDLNEMRWDSGFAELRDYVAGYGNAAVPRDYVSPSGFALGSWAGRQRGDYRCERLDESRVSLLNSVVGWEWEPASKWWSEGYAELCAHLERHGSTEISVDYVSPSGFRLGLWASTRRRDRRRGRLDATRERELESLAGWSWDPRGDVWDRGYRELREFVAARGDSRVPGEYISASGFALGRWVAKRRAAFHRGGLDADKADALSCLPGWAWAVHQSKWDQGINALDEFVAAEAHSRVPRGYVDASGFSLGRWVDERRGEHRAGALRPDRAAVLEGYSEWSWCPTDDGWDATYLRADEFCKSFGHCAVPQDFVTSDGFRLGAWISRQRIAYRSGKLSGDRVARVEALPGWAWDPLDAQWERGFAELVAYEKVNNHARVPDEHITGDGYRLGSWVRNQRTGFRAGKLSADRVARLESLAGRWWSARCDRWEQGYSAVAAFASVNGTARISQKYVTDVGFNLGLWVSRQRATYREGKLSADRIARLEALPGWTWDARA